MQYSFFEEIRPEVPRDGLNLSGIVPRPYQNDAIEGVFEKWKDHQSSLVVMPTGTGKSVVFSEVMRRCEEHLTGRMLVLAHRKELIFQAVEHAENAGLTAGIEMANHRADNEPVIVSTIQTLNAGSKCQDCRGEGCNRCDGVGKIKRMRKFDPLEFSVVIIDEAHHAAADSYRAVLAWFRQNAGVRILMVTATPKRTDKKGLHNVCDSVAYKMELRQAIEGGWLCPIRQQFIAVDGLDLSKVSKKNGGDLADGELEQAFLGETDIEEEKLLHAVTKPTLEIAKGQPTLVFASGQEHAKKLTAAFCAYDGVTAEIVIDKTDPVERAEIVRRYKRGDTQILVNVGCFTEGFDAPHTSVVANVRPTASESLYLQMIGRGTRPLKGIVDGPRTAEERREAIAESAKTHCTVLDFTGVSGNHQIVSVADVLAGDDCEPMDLAAAIELAKDAGESVDMEEMIEKAKKAREEHERRKEEERQQRIMTRHKADAASYTATDVDIFASPSFDPFTDYTPSPNGPSPAQLNYLMNLGVNAKTAAGYTRGQAGSVITRIKAQTGKDYVMRFGKHKGKRLEQLPRGYLQWAAKNLDNQEVQENIKRMSRG